MNIENNENNKFRDEYLEYYQGQLDKAKSSIKYPFIIAVLNCVSIALISILPDQLQYLPIITSIAGSIIITYLLYLLIKRINDRIYILFYISLILLINLGFFLKVWQYIDAFTAVTITTCTITFATIFLYYSCICSEDESLKYAHDVVQYIKSHISEDHTAVILKHDANKFMDGGDKNALPLIKVLNKYGEYFQIYLCLNEDNMVEVLTNPHVKRIWIFGHGKRGCLRLTDKLFSYENFMKEYDTELRKIGPREYVYQCHCNRGTAKPLTDCLLNKRKGLLDQKVDNMPNFFDTGLADLELDESIESKCRLRIAVSLCSTLGKRLSIDLNYNCPSSVEHIIKRYEAHLEKKRELAGKERKDLKKAYLDYYQGQLKKAKFRGKCILIIPILSITSLLLVITFQEQFPYLLWIVLIVGAIISIWWSLFLTVVISNAINLLTICSILPIFLGFFNILHEYFSLKYAEKVIPYIKPHKNENHTAIILAHDEERAMDGGDEPVQKLLEVLTKYNEDFQVYLCLYEEDMVNVLTNPFVKRIWIFGHGDRGGCCLTGKFFSYENFMTEKTDNGEKLRDIEPKEYVYQCHCNPKSTTPLTDYLLKEKELLNPDVDDMPNFLDSGMANMKVEFSLKHIGMYIIVQAFRQPFRILSKILHKDFNYTTPFSTEYFINKYAEHLEKKIK